MNTGRLTLYGYTRERQLACFCHHESFEEMAGVVGYLASDYNSKPLASDDTLNDVVDPEPHLFLRRLGG